MSLGTGHRIFLSFPTIAFVIKRAAKLWGALNDTGQGSVENLTPNSADFVVRECPGYPTPSQRVVSGDWQVVTEATGGKDVRVQHLQDDASTLRWTITWT